MVRCLLDLWLLKQSTTVQTLHEAHITQMGVISAWDKGVKRMLGSHGNEFWPNSWRAWAVFSETAPGADLAKTLCGHSRLWSDLSWLGLSKPWLGYQSSNEDSWQRGEYDGSNFNAGQRVGSNTYETDTQALGCSQGSCGQGPKISL